MKRRNLFKTLLAAPFAFLGMIKVVENEPIIKIKTNYMLCRLPDSAYEDTDTQEWITECGEKYVVRFKNRKRRLEAVKY